MGNKSTTGKQPRRLVVDFGNCLYDLIQNDYGDRPQLVHREGFIETSSRLIRFATLLGLAKGDKSLLEAVERAYIFITSNYLPGDQVILAVWTYFDHDTDCYAKAAQILARHLYYGTSPRKPSKFSFRKERYIAGSRIPIHGIVAWVQALDEIQSMSTWSDELKTRLPPGVQHMIILSCSVSFRSCSTIFDLNGAMISRELRFLRNDFRGEPWKDVMKHVLYYERNRRSKWGKRRLVWTHILSSSSREVQDLLSSESIKPIGMYYPELRMYQSASGPGGAGSMLVWKASRTGDRLKL